MNSNAFFNFWAPRCLTGRHVIPQFCEKYQSYIAGQENGHVKASAAAQTRKFSYAHRMVGVLVLTGVIGGKLFYSGLGDRFLLMAADAVLAVLLGSYFAVRSILEKENGRWLSWGYFFILGGAAAWALFNV